MNDERQLWGEIQVTSRAILELLLGAGANHEPLFVSDARDLGGRGLEGALVASAALANLQALGYVAVARSGARLSIRLTPRGHHAAVASADNVDEGLLGDEDFKELIELGAAPASPIGFLRIVGQEAAKQRLRPQIEYLRRTGRAFPNTLLTGRPGLGKTTLATAVGEESGWSCTVVSCPELDRRSVASLFSGTKKTVIILDELHAMPKSARQALLRQIDPAEDRSQLILAATSQPARLAEDVARRFMIVIRLDEYRPDEARALVAAELGRYGAKATPAATAEIERRARSSPIRIAQITAELAAHTPPGRLVTQRAARKLLGMMDVDERGMTKVHRRLHAELQRTEVAGLARLARCAGLDTDETLLLLDDLIEAGLARFVGARGYAAP